MGTTRTYKGRNQGLIMGIFDQVNEVIGAVKGWFDRCEEERRQEALEVLHPPRQESDRDDNLGEDAQGRFLNFDGSKKPQRGLMDDPTTDVAAPPLTPPPPTGHSHAPAHPEHAHMTKGKADPRTPPTPGEVAGLRHRGKNVEPDSGGLIQNETNDTMYNARNQVVAVIHQRYAKFGDSIATAVLTKAFMPNGLELLLTKLGLGSVGSQFEDHEQIVRFIDREGVAEFCRRAGIRYNEEKTKSERQTYEEKQKRRRTSQNFARQAKNGGVSPTMDLKKTGIKPVKLEKAENLPQFQSPAPAPPKDPGTD
ncbi:hypothetical protein KQI84_04180 [bacterium]|nr:hypothetical protein [bacterium]